MKRIFLFILFLSALAFGAQAQIIKGAGILYFDSLVNVNANTNGAELAWSIKLKKGYRWDRTLGQWIEHPVIPATDSTRLVQDSILLYYQSGSEIGRDTIRVPAVGGSDSHTYANVRDYGANGDGTDQTTAILTALATGKTLYFPSGDYIVNDTIVFADGQGAFGDGYKSMIRTTTAGQLLFFLNYTNHEIHSLRLVGTKGTTGTAWQTGIMIDGVASYVNSKSIYLHDLFIEKWATYGIRIQTSLGANYEGGSILNCKIDDCGTGLVLSTRAEYYSVTNVTITGCNTGVVYTGGNNTLVNCNISGNVTGISLASGTNELHGTISDCSIHHNSTAGISASGTTLENSFENCRFYYSDVKIENSDNLKFINCEFSEDSIIVNNSDSIWFVGSDFVASVQRNITSSSAYFVNSTGQLAAFEAGKFPVSDGDFVLNVASGVHSYKASTGTDTNFAEDNLTFSGNRVHNLSTRTLTIADGGTYPTYQQSSATDGITLASSATDIIAQTPGLLQIENSDTITITADRIRMNAADTRIQQVPNSNTLNRLMAIDSTNGRLYYVDKSSIAGGGGGSGTVTSVAAGVGIVASPSPITTTGTISADTTTVLASKTFLSTRGYTTGTGTTNTIAKWTSSTALGNSLFTDDGTNSVATGTASFRVPNGTTAQQPGSPAAGMTRYNTSNGAFEFYGASAWEVPVKSASATGLFTALRLPRIDANGRLAADLTSRIDPSVELIAIGSAPTSATGFGNIFFGSSSGAATTTGASNFFAGNSAGFANTTGNDNVFIGSSAGRVNVNGSNNFYLGSSSGRNARSGSRNLLFGPDAGFYLTSGNNNVFLGYQAGTSYTAADSITGSSNVLIGASVGRNLTGAGTGNVAIGNDCNLPTGTGSNQVVIKNVIFATGASGTGTTIAAGSKVGIKAPAPARDLEVAGEVRITDLTTDTPTRIVGADADGDLGTITIGTGLAFSSGTLSASPSYNFAELTVSGGSTSATAATPERPDNDTPGSATNTIVGTFTASGSTVDYTGAAGQGKVSAVISFTTSGGGDVYVSIYKEGVEIASTEVREAVNAIYTTVALPLATTAMATNDTFDIRIEPTSGSNTITVHRYTLFVEKIY